MRRLFAIGLVSALAGCEAEAGEPERLARAASAIVGGVESPAAHDAVVLLNVDGVPRCSGTLIATNLVLTARHCVTRFNVFDVCGVPLRGERDPTLYSVSVGSFAEAEHAVANGFRLFVPNAPRRGLCGADVALLLLDRELTTASVAKVSFATPSVHATTTALGYGDPRSGRRERSNVEVLALGPSSTPYLTKSGETFTMDLPANDLATSESACFGDSGGPLLDAEGKVVAVASRGLPDDPDTCADRPSYWTSLVLYEDLLRQAAIAAGHPLEGDTLDTMVGGSRKSSDQQDAGREAPPDAPAPAAAAAPD